MGNRQTLFERAKAMSITMNVPQTNLQCQHGISVAQTAWMYESMGYATAALNMYHQAIETLSHGISTLQGPAPDDALFHLGACQLRVGCMCQTLGDLPASRQWFQSSLRHLEEAWNRFPGNPWYQQALAQASILLGQMKTAQQVRETSPKSATAEKIGMWIDRALVVWDRMNPRIDGVQRAIPNGWSGTVMKDVFNGRPVWAGE